jgi:diguanylate cyclase (GGDEF)-like protein/PAS domain S-box-containing protein
MTIPIISFEIRFDQDVVNVRQQARLIAEMLGFTVKEQTSISTAVSEIARNCFQYAGDGIAEFSIAGTAPSQWLSIVIRDYGQGIARLDDILNGQFHSQTGMGKGIVGSRRLLPDYFYIETTVGQGTSVTLGKLLPAVNQPVSNVLLSEISGALAVFRAELPLELIRKQSKAALNVSRARQQTLLDTLMDGYLRIDTHGLVLDVNPAYLSQSGYTRNELLGMSIYDLESEDCNGLTATRLKSIAEIGADHFETSHCRKDGSIWFVEVSINFGDILNGQYFVFLHDITQRKEDERQLRVAAIAFEAHEGIFVTDADQVILKVNNAFTAITGYSPEEVIGRTPEVLSSKRHEAVFYFNMWQSINTIGTWQGEIWNRRKNGEGYAEYLTITAVKDEFGLLTNYVATFTDITLSKAAAEEIQQLAFYDPLTSLPNRRLLVDRLRQALASSARTGHQGAVLFIDLDNFKILNDTRGHDIGDLLLQQVAGRLTLCARETDTVARLGGDEFLVMLEGLSQDYSEAVVQAENIGNKILDTLNKPYELGDYPYHNTPSIGITLFSNHENLSDDLLKQADIAMYQAKNAGRNALRFFDQQMQENVNKRATLEAELRNAIYADQFKLFYQIQVDRENRPMGAEVLIRWLHPERGLVPPGHFIPIAEEVGLILPIGRWVLEAACIQLKLWQKHKSTCNLTLSVNVSPKQFHQYNFFDQVHGLVRRYKINPKLLKLELTESMLFENIEVTIETISTHKEIGIGFSLDDFGTGYSSLQYLKRLPLDQLKIDQSFVRDLLVDPNDATIVRTIIALGESLGLAVIAEGVETEEQRNFLEQHGCNHYQGYLFSKPVQLEDFEQLIKKFSPAELI